MPSAFSIPMKPHPVYSKYVEGEDVLRCLEETPIRIETLVRSWPRVRDDQSYAPGKWTARQLLAHLAHIEMVFTTRLRFVLTTDGHVVQTFEQDDWMAAEPRMAALTALDAYVSLRRMNVQLCRALTADQRKRQATHPEFGTIDVDWLMGWCAGHERHHLPQFETIARE
jgi:DinB superfamily